MSLALNFRHEASADMLLMVARRRPSGPNKPDDLTLHQWRFILLVSGYINSVEDHSSKTQLFPIELFVTLLAYTYCKPLGVLQRERKALLELKVSTRRQDSMRRALERDIVLEISNRNISSLHHKLDEDESRGGDCQSQQSLLTDILRLWTGEELIASHINDIDVAVQMAITNDNVSALATMLQHTLRDDSVYDSEDSRNRVTLQHINLAVMCGSIECLALLLGEPESLDWTGQLRDPECLRLAVQFHAHNLRVVHLVIDRLEQLNLRLDCAEIMEAAIERDLVDVARRLMDNDWHCITAQDKALARGKCKELFQEKTMARDVFVDNNSGDSMDIDDEDWDGAEDFSDVENESIW